MCFTIYVGLAQLKQVAQHLGMCNMSTLMALASHSSILSTSPILFVGIHVSGDGTMTNNRGSGVTFWQLTFRQSVSWQAPSLYLRLLPFISEKVYNCHLTRWIGILINTASKETFTCLKWGPLPTLYHWIRCFTIQKSLLMPKKGW